MVGCTGPILRHLNARNHEAILHLLRGSGLPGFPEPHILPTNLESFDNDSSLASRAVGWMAGVYFADELTSFAQARDGAFSGQMEATLFVDEKWRRRGFGTLLLKATTDWASRRQATTLRFVGARTDWPMRHFAKKFGARLDLVLGQMVAEIPLGQRNAEDIG
jgi:GNAT superfamily N-acetyltransferase